MKMHHKDSGTVIDAHPGNVQFYLDAGWIEGEPAPAKKAKPGKSDNTEQPQEDKNS